MVARYFATRQCPDGVQPPTWPRLQQALLNAHGSAPGTDSIPYEVLHPGAGIVSAIVGQAYRLAETMPGRMERVLGPAEDLLAWIPKDDDPPRVTNQRPLQLPNT
eukprot:5031887-Prorocentrum_lima.AAC.1